MGEIERPDWGPGGDRALVTKTVTSIPSTIERPDWGDGERTDIMRALQRSSQELATTDDDAPLEFVANRLEDWEDVDNATVAGCAVLFSFLGEELRESADKFATAHPHILVTDFLDQWGDTLDDEAYAELENKVVAIAAMMRAARYLIGDHS